MFGPCPSRRTPLEETLERLHLFFNGLKTGNPVFEHDIKQHKSATAGFADNYKH